jgi:3-oxoacyl-[acyl-carrier-protein] synthase-3
MGGRSVAGRAGAGRGFVVYSHPTGGRRRTNLNAEPSPGLRKARIAGLGKYLPEHVITNADLEKLVETSDVWIRERTGIVERRRAADDETASTLGINAGQAALEQAGIEAGELDLIIAATTSPDGMFPAVASYIQDGLGASRAAAFDINAACVGFVTAMATASQFIATGAAERVLVVGTDVLSRIVDWTDRGTCVLFADGAGAVVLEASDEGTPMTFVLKSDGSGANTLYAHGPGASPLAADPGAHFIRMDGRQIFKFAVHAMESVTRDVIRQSGLSVGDIDLLVPHQANLRIITATAKALGLPPEKAMINVDRYGNTSSASIPMALCEAMEQGRLHEGDKVVLVAFGGGLVWGALLLEWTPVGPVRAQTAKAKAPATA